jgi:hypothetical protein
MNRQLGTAEGCTRISGRTSPRSAGDRMSDGPDPRTCDMRQPSPSDQREADHLDPRDALVSDLHLLHGREPERVYVHGEAYPLCAFEMGALATIGTFRVVLASDLRDDRGEARNLRNGDLERVRTAASVPRVALVEAHRRTTLVALTERGRALPEHHPTPDREAAQRFCTGPSKARELTHDTRLYRSYIRRADRLHAQSTRTHRVVLDDGLKRQHQAYLQEGDRDQPESDRRPRRTHQGVHESTFRHDVPMLDDAVQFPDLRVEHEWPDGQREIEHVEGLTPHDRSARAAAKARSGLTCCRGSGPRVDGRSGRSGRGRRPFDPDLADEFL